MENVDHSDELKALLSEAVSSGKKRIKTEDGDILLIAPRNRTGTTASPFADSDELIDPPNMRAAYSDRTAWLMAVMSDLAYKEYEGEEEEEDSQHMLISNLSDAGFNDTCFIGSKETGTEGFIAVRDNGFAVLAFRGTEKDTTDIKTDLSARFYDTEDGKAHRGFSVAYESVDAQIREELIALEQKYSDLQLYVTGHSLGGALATIAAQNLEEQFVISACYTYGSPRVGNPEWSDSIKTPVYRVVNGADIVPMLPLGTSARNILLWLSELPVLSIAETTIKNLATKGFMGFQHAGDMRFLQGGLDNAGLKIGSSGAWSRFRHVAFCVIFSPIRSFSLSKTGSLLTDHKMAGYTKKLHTIAKRKNLDGDAS